MDELSTGASLVPRVKRAVQSLDMGICRRLAEEILLCDSSDVILAKCEEVAKSHYPDLLP